MLWRHLNELFSQKCDQLVDGIVKRISSSFSDILHWDHISLHTLGALLALAGLISTVLIGSFLRDFLSRKNKNVHEQSSPFPEFYPFGCRRPDVVVALPELTKSGHSAPVAPEVSHSNYFESDVFDPELDYAQVLNEANKQATKLPETLERNLSPLKLTRSLSARNHDPLFDDMETVFASHREGHVQGIIQGIHKPSKSWKSLLFWKRSKKSSGISGFHGSCYSNCSTPQHPSFKPRQRGNQTPSTASAQRKASKRPTSGQMYSDGATLAPSHRSHRGSTSGYSTPSPGPSLYDSPYLPLHPPPLLHPHPSSPLLYLS